jgi:serine/threonine protein kinase
MSMAIQSALPDKIGPFRVVRRLGQGGMGVVFEGVHEEIERRVAIKLLKSEFARDREVARRFFNEARAVNRVGHPGIVQVSEFGHQPDGTAYLVMEYLEGQTLRQLQLDRNGPIPIFETIQLARQIAAALNAAHQKGIIHRDLKPENVMLVADDAVPGGQRAKLLDFGLAKVLTQAAVTLSKTPDHHIMGTPVYMSPDNVSSVFPVGDHARISGSGGLWDSPGEPAIGPRSTSSPPNRDSARPQARRGSGTPSHQSPQPARIDPSFDSRGCLRRSERRAGVGLGWPEPAL